MAGTRLLKLTVHRARALRGHLRAFRQVRRAEAALAVPPSGSFAAMGVGSLIVPPTRIADPRGISVGAGVVVLEHSWLHTLPGGEIVVGDHVSINRFVKIVAARRVHLEGRVILSDRVYLSDVEYVPAADAPADDHPLTEPAPVLVGEGAFLGAGVVVKPGVTIGRYAYIGASSVVTEDVPAYSMAVGNPARVVRTFDPPDRS